MCMLRGINEKRQQNANRRETNRKMMEKTKPSNRHRCEAVRVIRFTLPVPTVAAKLTENCQTAEAWDRCKFIYEGRK